MKKALRHFRVNFFHYYLWTYGIAGIAGVCFGGRNAVHLIVPVLCIATEVYTFCVREEIRKKWRAFRMLIRAKSWIVISAEGEDFYFTSYISGKDLQKYCPGIHEYFKATDGAVEEVNEILSKPKT